MKQGKILVDQVTQDGLLIEGYDVSLSPSEIFDQISNYFPKVSKTASDSRVFVGNHKGHKIAIRCKNVTYLGNPHPHFKKRIQISDDLYDFYRFALSIEAEPILLGIYSFKSNTIFVDFKIDTYIEKKAHNSSAHVYVSDLAAATEDGYFQKTDFFGNTVTAIRPDVVNVYLDELFGISESNDVATPGSRKAVIQEKHYVVTDGKGDREFQVKQKDGTTETVVEKTSDVTEADVERVVTYAKVFRRDIVPRFKAFFDSEDKDWNGIECYQTMITANYRNKYQPEWVGFFLEYEFEKYLTDNKLHHLITYAQDKTDGGIDLDLYFPTIESYGDLKAHSEESRGIQGNDWDTIFGIINGQDEKSHVYYIVCEHATEKDNLHDYEVTKFWNGTRYIILLDEGYPIATARFFEKSKNHVIIGRVVVLPEYRGHGMGRKVLQEAENWICELGYREIEVDSRTVAVGFYEKNGYQCMSDETVKSGSFECIRMHKHLENG